MESTCNIKRDTLIPAEENRAMFDSIAPNYDAASRAVSFGMDRGWRRRAVAKLKQIDGGRYLDIGTGTGDLIFEMIRQMPNAKIDAVDAAFQMLRIACSKVKEKGLDDQVDLSVSDALSLPANDDTYDGVILGFCFRNIEDRKGAIKEIRRVLKPGARLVILEATYPENCFIRLGYFLYRPFVPIIGRLKGGGKSFCYLVESIKHFPRSREVMDQLSRLGFQNTRCLKMAGGVISVYSADKQAEDE